MPLVARISRKTEVPSALTLRVEVKEPTEDEKHSGSDHPQRFNHINTAPLGATNQSIKELLTNHRRDIKTQGEGR